MCLPIGVLPDLSNYGDRRDAAGRLDGEYEVVSFPSQFYFLSKRMLLSISNAFSKIPNNNK